MILKLCQNTNLVQMAEQMISNELKNVFTIEAKLGLNLKLLLGNNSKSIRFSQSTSNFNLTFN